MGYTLMLDPDMFPAYEKNNGILYYIINVKSSHCNSFEDLVAVDLIYVYPIFKWVAETRGPSQYKYVLPVCGSQC